MVRDLDSNWFAQTTVGGSINNALCISRHPRGSDGPRLLICNNDETIKVHFGRRVFLIDFSPAP